MKRMVMRTTSSTVTPYQMVCPQCGGHGVVKVFSSGNTADLTWTAVENAECGSCKGAGWVYMYTRATI